MKIYDPESFPEVAKELTFIKTSFKKLRGSDTEYPFWIIPIDSGGASEDRLLLLCRKRLTLPMVKSHADRLKAAGVKLKWSKKVNGVMSVPARHPVFKVAEGDVVTQFRKRIKLFAKLYKLKAFGRAELLDPSSLPANDDLGADEGEEEIQDVDLGGLPEEIEVTAAELQQLCKGLPGLDGLTPEQLIEQMEEVEARVETRFRKQQLNQRYLTQLVDSGFLDTATGAHNVYTTDTVRMSRESEARLATRPGLGDENPLDERVQGLKEKFSSAPINAPLLLSPSQITAHPHLDGPIVHTDQRKIPSVKAMFPPLDPKARDKATTETRRALEAFPVRSADGTTDTTLWDKLGESSLTEAQKQRVLDCVAEFYHSLSIRDFDLGGSEVNWKHICGEMGQVVDACLGAELTAEETEDSLLASLFSDAVKFGGPGGNLMTHNIDGALAAYHVLSRRGDTDISEERLAGIVSATREHQIGPPSLWAMFMGFGAYAEPEKDALASLQRKLADPMNPDHVIVDDSGAARIDFTEAEHELLLRKGIEEWWVPNPTAPWYKASMAVIVGDSVVNYANPEGPGKIAMICGPGTFVRDETVFHSVFSCGNSFKDARRIVPDEFREIFDTGAAYTKKAVKAVHEEVSSRLKAGYLELDAATFRRDCKTDSVDLEQLTLTLPDGSPIQEIPDEGALRVHVDGAPNQVPFFHEPLDYGNSRHCEAAKVIRRVVADKLRSHTEWMQVERGGA